MAHPYLLICGIEDTLYLGALNCFNGYVKLVYADSEYSKTPFTRDYKGSHHFGEALRKSLNFGKRSKKDGRFPLEDTSKNILVSA